MWTRRRLLLLGVTCAVVALAAPAIGAFFPAGSPVRFVTLPIGGLGLFGAFTAIGAGLWTSRGSALRP